MLRKELKKEENFEELIAHIPEEIREEHLHEILTDVRSLRDVSVELRKKEADQPIYLIRYE